MGECTHPCLPLATPLMCEFVHLSDQENVVIVLSVIANCSSLKNIYGEIFEVSYDLITYCYDGQVWT